MNEPPSAPSADRSGGLVCPDCGAPIPRASTGGLCPSCILSLAASSHDALADAEPDRRAHGNATSGRPAGGDGRPRFFGDYELVREIARGGMGVVYEARQLSLERTVALKMIDARLLGSTAARMRFRMEIETAARLDHPNIISLHETGEHDDRAFYAMRFVRGGSLADRLRAGSLTEPQLVAVTAKVARAVQHAHEHGVLHRDIKPSNILLDEHDEPYLADFGLAKAAGDDLGLTRSEAMLGSPNYVAPEQVCSGDSVTTAADIYSLGAVLYEIIAGRPPFQAATALETIRQVVDSDPVPPHALRSSVDHDLEAIALKCLEKDPSRRYATARDLADDLGRWQRGEPIEARRIGAFRRGWRWCRRHPAIATLAAASIVFLAGIAAVSSVSAVRIAAARDRNAELLGRVRLEQAETLLAQDQTGAGLALLARVCRDEPGNLPAHQRLAAALFSRMFGEAGTSLERPSGRIMTIHPDFAGRSVTGVTDDGQVHRWPMKPGAAPATFVDKDQPLSAAAIDPTGGFFALAAKSGPVTIADGHGQPLGPALDLPKPASRVALSPHAGRAATRIEYDAVELWDPRTGGKLAEIAPSPGKMSFFTFSPDGGMLAAAVVDSGVRLCDGRDGRTIRDLECHARGLIFLTFSPDGRRLAGADAGGSIVLWDLHDEAASPAFEQSHGERRANGIAFDPDGARMVSFSSDGRVRLWTAATGALEHTIELTDFATDARFSEDGRWLITASHDYTARIWDAGTGLPVTEPLRHHSGVSFATVDRTRGEAWCLCFDNAIVRWDLSAPSMAPIVVQTGAPVLNAFAGDDGARILAESSSPSATRIQEWLLQNGTLVAGPAHFDLPAPATEIAFSRDGRRAAIASRTIVQCLDAATLEPIGPRVLHPNVVRSVDFDASGDRLVTASLDGTARIIDIAASRVLDPPLPHEGALEAAFFSPLRRDSVLTAGGQSSLFLWSVNGQGSPGPTIIPCASLSPNIIRIVLGGRVNSKRVKLSPDGAGLLVIVGSETILVDATSGSCVGEHLMHRSAIHEAAFNVDGTRVVTAARDNTAQIWRVDESGAARMRALHHLGPVVQANFSPDGTLVATASEDATARIWDVESGIPITGPLVHDGPVNTARFSGDGRRLVTASQDGTVRLWKVPAVAQRDMPGLPLLAEAASGLRIEANGEPAPLSYDEMESLRAEIRGKREER